METGRKLRVGVIYGGRSGEHEVSLMSARSVLAAIDRSRYEVVQIGIAHDGSWWVGGDGLLDAFVQAGATGQLDTQQLSPAAIFPDPSRHALYSLNPADHPQDHSSHSLNSLIHLTDLDVVFPVLHGTYGEDGTLQGLLEMADLAYVGAGVLGSALGMDKGVFKDVMRAHAIPVVDSIVVLRREIEQDVQAVIQRALQVSAFPLFVKPANLGSSVGITRCTSPADLLEGLYEAARFDRRVLVERGVNAREIEISVLGNDDPQASAAGEIVPSREYYSYEAKYIDGDSVLLIPAPIDPQVAERARHLAVRAYRAVDCAGMARVDFLLEKETPGAPRPAELYLNEINTIPGFTQISMYSKLWEASGLSYPALIDRLIELALERKADRDHTERRYRREG
ncbi:MAG: D-alanine--D-alanine ligase family protein [Chloroflexota bacterium]